KLAVDAFLHDHAAGRGAALAGRAESSPENAFQSEIEIGIVKNDDGVFAAHFQRAGLKAARGGFSHNSAYFAGTGKGDSLDIRMFSDRCSGFWSKTSYHVDYALGQASVSKGFEQVHGGERRIFRWLDHAGVAADQRRQQLP